MQGAVTDGIDFQAHDNKGYPEGQGLCTLAKMAAGICSCWFTRLLSESEVKSLYRSPLSQASQPIQTKGF